MKIPKITLLNSNAKKICEVKEAAIVTVNIGEENFEIEFLIIDRMDYEAIMGGNTLQKYQAKIDYDTKIVKIGRTVVQLFIDGEDQESPRIMNSASEGEDKECILSVDDSRKVSVNTVMKFPKLNKRVEHDVNNDRYINWNNYNDVEEITIENLVYCASEEKAEMLKVLQKFPDLHNEKIRVATKYTHSFEVKGIESFKSKTYPIPYKHKEKVTQEIRKMEEKGIIEKANTPYINPIVVVNKSSGEIRLCLDARNLNKHSVPQYETPMNIEAIFGKITKACVMSKLDLKHSFWLIPLSENSRNYTGFTIDGVVYRFSVCPFGIQSASSALIRVLHDIFNKYEDFLLHYVDDILIYSENKEAHYRHIKIALEELDKAGLKINLEKCKFFQYAVTFLGYKITSEGIEMDADRAQAIQDYARPTNLKTLRGFIGLVNYFKRLIPEMSEKLEPLFNMLKKNQHWKWDEEKEQAFQNIKKTFCEKLRVFHPDYEEEFTLRTDASKYKLAGTLLQQRKEHGEVPICFVSRVTKEYERKYGSTELELASIVFAVQKLRFYLIGGHFIIETDNAALTQIMKSKIVNNRIQRWAMLLQEYNFTIKHILGKENVVADAITRDDGTNKINKRTAIIAVNILKEKSGPFSRQAILADQLRLTERERRNCMNKDRVWVKRMKEGEVYVITKILAMKISRELHEKNYHIGIRKLWMLFRENYYAKNDLKIIKDIVNKCHICQMSKTKNWTNANIPKSIIPKCNMDIVAMDFVGELTTSWGGNKNVLVLVDTFSKFVKLYPTKRTNGETVVNVLRKYEHELGNPKNLIVDNATYFHGKHFTKYCQRKSIQIRYTSIRHPNSNPAERYIRELIKYLRIVVQDEHRNWENHIQHIEAHMNNMPSSNNETPIWVMKKQFPERRWQFCSEKKHNDMVDIINEQIRRNAERYCRRMAKQNKKKTKFEQGDLVIVRSLKVADTKNHKCAKLILPFKGPYEVLNEAPVNSYLVGDPVTKEVRGVYNIHDVYKYKE